MNPLDICILLGTQQGQHRITNLFGKKRRHGIAYLNKLFCSIAFDEVVIRKCLQAGSFSDRQ